MPEHAIQILVVVALLLTQRSWAEGVIQAVNQRPESLAVLCEAARASGMSVRVTDAKTAPLNAELLAWEVRKGDDSSLTKARADQIQAYVQSGRNLLVSCGLLTWDQLYRLTAVCPTTGWHGLCGRRVDGERRVNKGAAVIRWNRDMYCGLDLTGSRISYHYSIRPFHQVERGIQRYERYEATWRHLGKGFIFAIQDKNYALPADHTFWTRPLMNRSWRNEVVLDNIDGTALLMTGRCGRGKVAVLATAISETADWDECQAFWGKTLDWLKTKDDFEEDLPPPVVPSAGERVVASVPGDSGIALELLQDRPTRSLGVRLNNDSDESIPAGIVIRLSTWQRALVKDLHAKVVVPARESKTMRWILPKPGLTGYQALAELDEYDIRLGVIDADGGAMLVDETHHRIHLADTLKVDVFADNLYTVVDYPFPGSAMDNTLGNVMQHDARMGHPTHAYACKPGSPVNCTIEISNGLRNLSPLAKVTDEVNPENVSVCAINDQGGSYNGSYAIGDGIVGYSDWRGKHGVDNVLRFDFREPVRVAMITLVGSMNEPADNPGAVVVEIDGKVVAEASDLDKRFRDGHGRAFIGFTPVKGHTLRLRFPWNVRVSGTESPRQLPRLADIQVGGFVGESFPDPIAEEARWNVVDALTKETIASGTTPVAVEPASRTAISFQFITPALADRKDVQPIRVDVAVGDATDSIPNTVVDPERFFTPRTERLAEYYASKGVRQSFPIGTGTREVLRNPPSVTQCPEPDYRGVLAQTGVEPIAMWRSKYYKPGQCDLPGSKNSFVSYLNSLHRRAYGNSLLVMRFPDERTAQQAASRIAGGARLRNRRGNMMTGIQPIPSSKGFRDPGNPDIATWKAPFSVWSVGQWVYFSSLPIETNRSIR